MLALLACYMVTPFSSNRIDHGAAVDDDDDDDNDDDDDDHDNDHDNDHDKSENESDDNDLDYAFHMITSHNYNIYIISILLCYPSLPVLNIMFQQMRFMLHQTVQAPLESSDTSSSSTSYGSDGS